MMPLLTLLWACTPTPSGPVLQAPARLVDTLHDAHWTGPPAQGRTLIEDDFSQAGPWVGGGRLDTTVGQSGDGAAILGDLGDMPRPSWTHTTPAPPRSRCHAQAWVSTDNLDGNHLSAGAGLGVVERRSPGGTVTARHSTVPLRGTTPWALQTLDFETDGRTRSVDLVLSGGDGNAPGRAIFDNVRLDCVDLLGTLETGPPGATRVTTLTLAGDTRRALLAPAGSRWAVWVDPGTTGIHVRTAVGTEARSGPGPLCFQVHAGGTPLAETCVSSDTPDAPGWTPLTVDVPAGPPVELALVASGSTDTGPLVGGWADPRLLPGPAAALSNAAAPTQPDILLVVVDTLRADALAIGGGPPSPAWSALAAQGVTHTQARSDAPWTLPSAATLLTGLKPSGHGAGWRTRSERPSGGENKALARRVDHLGIAPDVTTLAETLQAAGYQTAAIVSNHYLAPEFGFARGFDRHVAYDGNSYGGGLNALDVVDTLVNETPRALGPRFVWVHLFEPHMPVRLRDAEAPPAALAGIAQREVTGEHHAWLVRDHSPAATAHPDALRTLYQADVAWADSALSALLQRFPEAAVVATADHGEAFGEHKRFGHGDTLYDDVLRIPLVVRDPKGTGAGTTSDRPVTLGDAHGFLRELAGLPSLDDRTVSGSENTLPISIFEAAYRGPDRVAVVLGPRKLITTLPAWGLDSRVGAARLERQGFLLNEDPAEQHPVPLDETWADLVAATADHLSVALPGVHLRCAPGFHAFIHTTGALLRLVPLDLPPDANLGLPPGRRTVDLNVPLDGPEAWIVVESADGGVPTVVPEAACTVTVVEAPGSQAGLDAERREALHAIGYIE